MSVSPVITLEHVSKEFRIPRRKDATVLSRISGIVSGKELYRDSCSITAVSDVSLSVNKGEVIGIIGQNASGKSTLLRLIANILVPDTGTVYVQEPVTSLINLSVGLRQHLTVRDNIFLACSLFGMCRSEIREVFNSIISFAGIEPFADMYVYQLSVGMAQRLAFSIAVHTKPKILLLDEVFSAGDLAFAKKSNEKMTELVRSDVTVVMVSHALPRIKNLADRVIWIDKGAIREEGDPEKVVQSYTQFSES